MNAFIRATRSHRETGGLTTVTPGSEHELAVRQLVQLGDALKRLGAQVQLVQPAPERLEDCFIETAAVLLPQVVVAARSVAPLEAQETVLRALGEHRPLQGVIDPGVLDGSDTLRVGRTVFVAESGHTNREGVEQLQQIAETFGCEVRPVTLRDAPNLKAACTFIPPHFIVANPAWVDPTPFANLVLLAADESEPSAANTLSLLGTTLVSKSFPRTEARLRAAGIATQTVDISAFERVGGNLTRLCVLLESRASGLSVEEIGLRAIQTPNVPASDKHAAQAIVHAGLVYVSPQSAFDPAAPPRPRPGLETQTEQALGHVAGILISAGSSLARVLKITLHLSDAKHLARIDLVYDRIFDGHRPTRVVVVNAALPPGVLIEVEVVAALGEATG